MGFILGAVLGIFLISSLIELVALRKIAKPKRHYFSVPIAWLVATLLAGYGMADGGDPQFYRAAINYGIASIILLAICLAAHSLQKARRKPDQATGK